VPAVAVVGDDWPAYAPGVDGWTRRWRGPVAGVLAPAAERVAGVPARLDLDRAARWTFVSAHALAAGRAAGWRLASAAVHHPGVDPAGFPSTPAAPWAWRLLYCGRIDPRKGIATAVRALAELPGGAVLTVHGDGDAGHAGELRALAARLGVADRVRFSVSGPAEVGAVYRACDVLLFPVTWEEPWGLVPLEAMATGRPVLASDAGGGPAEYLESERNCLRFAAGDAPALAAALRRLAADEQLRTRIVAGGSVTAAGLPQTAFHRAVIGELEAAVAAGRPA
jgi:glycosyltransferase involved in cell wall biosynthesis